MEWLKELRMASLKKAAPRIVLFLALAAGVFVYFRCWTLLGVLAPKTLADLTPETMEGAYVEDDVYWLYTPYLEEYVQESGKPDKLTGVQYVMDFDDVYYMGIFAHQDNLDRAEELMEAVDAFHEGELDYDDVPVMHVKGMIQAMDEEERGYYLELTDGNAELAATFLPYYLDMDRLNGQPVIAELLLLLGSLALLAAALFPLVKALSGGYQKKVRAKLAESGDLETAAERAALFYDRTEPVGGMRMGSEYVYFLNGAESVLLRPWDVAWGYQSTTQHRTNGIPTGKTYAVVLRTMDGSQYTLPVKKEEEAQRLLEAMEMSLPGVVLGYTEEIEKLYKQNRSVFSERWEEKVPGCTGVRRQTAE